MFMEVNTLLPKNRIDQLNIENVELRNLLQKEIANNRLKMSFLAEASHQLRSPLTNIQLSASLIEHYYDRMDKQKIFGHLDKIKIAVGDFVAILDHYLLVEAVEKDQLNPETDERI